MESWKRTNFSQTQEEAINDLLEISSERLVNGRAKRATHGKSSNVIAQSVEDGNKKRMKNDREIIHDDAL